MRIKLETGFAIEKEVEVVINSANNLLMLGSSGAGRIRDLSKEINEDELKEYLTYFSKLPKEIQNFYLQQYKKHHWKLKFAQLSSVKKLYENEFPFKIGDAVLDTEWCKQDKKLKNKIIIHAITMGYSTSQPIERLFGTKESIIKSYIKALELALNLEKTKIAIPIPVARKGYGIGCKSSYLAVKKVLSLFKDEDIEVTLCFDNSETKEFLKKELIPRTS